MKAALTLAAALLLAACHPTPPAGSRIAALESGFERTHIKGIHNLSGVTWSDHSKTLFAIGNRPTVVVELDRTGQPLRWIALKGFEDTEDIAWLGGDRFAVVEERQGTVVLLRLPAKAASVHRQDGRVLTIPGGAAPENRGYEGLAYDALTDTLYAAHEGDRHLMRISGLHQPQPQFEPFALPDAVGSDVGGIHFDADRRHLLVLSERSHRLSELDAGGRALIAQRRVGSLLIGIRQPEGLTLDDRGHLYVAGEPDRLYLYAARPAR